MAVHPGLRMAPLVRAGFGMLAAVALTAGAGLILQATWSFLYADFEGFRPALKNIADVALILTGIATLVLAGVCIGKTREGASTLGRNWAVPAIVVGVVILLGGLAMILEAEASQDLAASEWGAELANLEDYESPGVMASGITGMIVGLAFIVTGILGRRLTPEGLGVFVGALALLGFVHSILLGFNKGAFLGDYWFNDALATYPGLFAFKASNLLFIVAMTITAVILATWNVMHTMPRRRLVLLGLPAAGLVWGIAHLVEAIKILRAKPFGEGFDFMESMQASGYYESIGLFKAAVITTFVGQMTGFAIFGLSLVAFVLGTVSLAAPGAATVTLAESKRPRGLTLLRASNEADD